MFQGSVEVLALDRALFIESPANCHLDGHHMDSMPHILNGLRTLKTLIHKGMITFWKR